jgi:uncharacterized membrane protein YbhN (UPF0104 family)
VLYFFSVLLGFGVLAAVGYHAGISESLAALKRLSPAVAVSLVATYSLAWLARGQRLRQLLALLHTRGGIWESVGIEVAADLANYVLPAKIGDVAKVVCLKKRKSLGVAQGIVAAFLIRLTDLAAVVLLAVVSMAWLAWSGDRVAVGFWAVAAVAAAAVAGLAALFLAGGDLVLRVKQGWWGRVLRPLRPLGTASRMPSSGLIGVLATATAVWGFEVLTFYCLMRAMDVGIGLWAAVFALMLANLSKIVPLTPLGLGVFEGTMVLLLVQFGADRADAFALAVVFHAFANVFTFLLGVTAVILFRWDFSALRTSFAAGRTGKD